MATHLKISHNFSFAFQISGYKMRLFYHLYKPLCIAFIFIVFLVLAFFLFCEPEQANYYLPKNVVQNIKTAESNTCKFLKVLLQLTLLDELFQKRLRHKVPQRVIHQPVKHLYPRRKNMEECKPLFGTIGVFVAVNTDHDKK